jgi:hypothetical protein
MKRMDRNTDLLDNKLEIKTKNAWYIFAGWSTLLFSVLFQYFSLKQQITDAGLNQSKTDALQDLRLDGFKRDIEIQNLQIKDLNERYNELQSKVNSKQ